MGEILQRIPESRRLLSQLFELTRTPKVFTPSPVMHHQLIFDRPACSQLLMLIVCAVGADSKGDGCPEWTSVLYKALPPDGPGEI